MKPTKFDYSVQFDLRKHTILVVEDDAANLKVISEYLDSFGLEVLIARNGEEGIQKANYGRPDLILLDVLMPGIDGFEVCRKLKAEESTKDIPVIFMTSLASTTDIVRGFDVGGVDYITKPIQTEEVLARVATQLKVQEQARALIKTNNQLTQEVVERRRVAEELRLAQAELEQRVAVRTMDLSKANEQLKLEIKERRRAEKEVRRLNQLLEQRVIRRTAQLEASNKELEAFAYSVSHDLRAPLRAIDGFSQAVLDDYGHLLDAAGRDYLQRVRAASRRLGRLIDDLLQLARVARSEFRRELVDLSALAERIIANLIQIEPGRKLKFVVEPGLESWGDPQLLRIVLENLLGNAWKFTSKEGFAEITFGQNKKDKQPIYYVRDNGVGFDMAYIDKLFGTFQRLHSDTEFEGTGIGLATVERIIRRHGGRVWADAAVDQGATFYFTLQKPDSG